MLDGSEQERPRMKETDADREVRDKAYRVTADELRQFIERFERLEYSITTTFADPAAGSAENGSAPGMAPKFMSGATCVTGLVVALSL